jgi:nucleotide-binding universal stress UspA family protein
MAQQPGSRARWLAVVGVDGSPAAQAALAWAIRAAARRDGAVHVVHIWRRHACPATFPSEQRDAAEALLVTAIEAVPDRRGVRISSQAIEGDVARELWRAARDADILVLGRDAIPAVA